EKKAVKSEKRAEKKQRTFDREGDLRPTDTERADIQKGKDDRRRASKTDDKPPLIGDPKDRGIIKDVYEQLKSISKIAPVDFMAPIQAVRTMFASKTERRIMYGDLKTAETDRDILNGAWQEKFDSFLKPFGLQQGSTKRAKMSNISAAQQSVFNHLVGKVPGLKAGPTKPIFTNHDIVGGQQVSLVGDEVATIIASTENPDQRASFLESGIVIDRFKRDPAARAGGHRTIKMTEAQLDKLRNNATVDEKALAAASIKFFSEVVKPEMLAKAKANHDTELQTAIEKGGIYFPTSRDFTLATTTKERTEAAKRESTQVDPKTGFVTIDNDLGR
ncbi:unnamed protein product, partial [marine sediment metagenome]